MVPPRIPYWRLSSFYFYFFGLLGALLPFWGLYLREQGFSLGQIGQLMAILVGTKLVAPNAWGWLADHTGHRLTVIRFGAVLAVLIFAFMFSRPGFWGMALVMAGFSFFWNAILPQFEVITLRHLGPATDRYSRIRVWGSVGFVCAVVGLGWYFDAYPLTGLPYVALTLLMLIAVSSFLVHSPEGRVVQRGSLQAFIAHLRQPQVILFFSICFLMQVSHGPYYAFFSIYMEDYGHSKTVIGVLWAWGVVAEIGVFLIMHRLFRRFNVRTLTLACLLLAAGRWLVTGMVPQYLGVIFLVQTAHAATFGVFHAVAIYLIHRFFSKPAAGQGQALYSALSFGAGGAAGAYISGIIVENQGASMAYLMAGLAALLASGLALGLRSHTEQREFNDGSQSA
ncbi:MAG: MFS transporter [Pseudomonadales bacterium]|nr:MFS transporter [Pseudomonadales bacterium]